MSPTSLNLPEKNRIIPPKQPQLRNRNSDTVFDRVLLKKRYPTLLRRVGLFYLLAHTNAPPSAQQETPARGYAPRSPRAATAALHRANTSAPGPLCAWVVGALAPKVARPPHVFLHDVVTLHCAGKRATLAHKRPLRLRVGAQNPLLPIGRRGER